MDKVITDKWVNRYLNIALEVAEWSSCLRRKVGCVITQDRRIVATGYNGSPSGIKSCRERGYCTKEAYEDSDATRVGYNYSYAVHAEQNAIYQASRQGIPLLGATLFCTHQPCSTCLMACIQVGISTIYYIHPYNDTFLHNNLLPNITDEVINLIHYIP